MLLELSRGNTSVFHLWVTFNCVARVHEHPLFLFNGKKESKPVLFQYLPSTSVPLVINVLLDIPSYLQKITINSAFMDGSV